MEKKICSKCGVEKETCEFPKDKTKKDGIRPSCKICNRNYFRIKREENPDMMSLKLKEFSPRAIRIFCVVPSICLINNHA